MIIGWDEPSKEQETLLMVFLQTFDEVDVSKCWRGLYFPWEVRVDDDLFEKEPMEMYGNDIDDEQYFNE